MYPRALYKQLQHLVGIQQELHDHEAMTRTARELAPMLADGGASYSLAAECFARAIALAAHDGYLSLEQRREKADTYAQATVQMLEQALAHGFSDLKQLKYKLYDPLRKRPDFKRLFQRAEGGQSRITRLPRLNQLMAPIGSRFG